jgi:hypothetical protein
MPHGLRAGHWLFLEIRIVGEGLPGLPDLVMPRGLRAGHCIGTACCGQ